MIPCFAWHSPPLWPLGYVLKSSDVATLFRYVAVTYLDAHSPRRFFSSPASARLWAESLAWLWA